VNVRFGAARPPPRSVQGTGVSGSATAAACTTPRVEVYQTLQDIYDRRLEHWTPRQVLTLSNAHGLLFPPGTAFSYSNTNYVVAGLLIERVTGTAIAGQLERRIIRPLGLRHTWFPADTAAPPPPRLHGYMALDDQPPLVDADITWFNPSFFWARGRWSPTSRISTGSTTPCSTGACCPRLLAEMLAPNDTGVPGWSYGLAWRTTPCPAGRWRSATPGRLYGYNSGSFRLLGATRTPAWSPTSTPPPTPVRRLLQRPGRAVLRDDPGRGRGGRPANPAAATSIRFR
jgi:D-alanyl-D-alanine carboxypeptidase